MVTDETNRMPQGNIEFFIYGGLFFPIDLLGPLDEEIVKIRTEAGYKPGDTFKFDTNARTNHVSIEKCTEAKRKVETFCLNNGCKFISYVILHDIVKNQDEKTVVTWAADHVIGRFNKYLSDISDIGICAIDSFPVEGQFKFLSDKFTNGLKLDDGKNVSLDRIKLFSVTCINASHANSAMDIVLVSFRYCINNPQNINAAKEMMVNVLKMMWHTREGGNIYIEGKGLITRPIRENIKREDYKNPILKSYTNKQSKLTTGYPPMF